MTRRAAPCRVSPCGATAVACGGKGGKPPPGVSRGRLMAPAGPPPAPRNLRGPNSRGLPATVRRGRDNDCPRIRAAAAISPKSRWAGMLGQTGAPDRSGSNLCGGELAGGSEYPPLQGNFGRYGFTAAPGSDQPWQRVQVGVRRTDPSPEDRDARRARRLGAPPYRVSLACLPPQNVSPPPRREGLAPSAVRLCCDLPGTL